MFKKEMHSHFLVKHSCLAALLKSAAYTTFDVAELSVARWPNVVSVVSNKTTGKPAEKSWLGKLLPHKISR